MQVIDDVNQQVQHEAKAEDGLARAVLKYFKTIVQQYFILRYLTMTLNKVIRTKTKNDYFNNVDGPPDGQTNGPTDRPT